MKQPAPIVRPSVAVRFKTEIESAAAEGIDPDDMALHLTLGDAELLKRDRTVPISDISFAGGTMRFLGVRVVKGNVPTSSLQRVAAAAQP
ncbi:MAG: hypothetical protein ACXU82_07105 [Caulobacteraceae bacterium]